MNDATPLPCPYCGGHAHPWNGADGCYVVCAGCAAHGPWIKRKSTGTESERAVAAWNAVASLKADLDMAKALLKSAHADLPMPGNWQERQAGELSYSPTMTIGFLEHRQRSVRWHEIADFLRATGRTDAPKGGTK